VCGVWPMQLSCDAWMCDAVRHTQLLRVCCAAPPRTPRMHGPVPACGAPGTCRFTGLSGSGKSTVACTLEHALFERGRLTALLDGDNVRHGLNKNLGFSAADRCVLHVACCMLHVVCVCVCVCVCQVLRGLAVCEWSWPLAALTHTARGTHSA
jgi:hypothetical protein